MTDTTKTITGTVELSRSSGDGADCVCCDGNHVYCQEIKLDQFASRYPTHFRQDVDRWLRSVFEYKELSGRRIRITAEVLK